MEIHSTSKQFDQDGNQKGHTLTAKGQKAQADEPEGMQVKGISRFVDSDGNITAEWRKYDRNKVDAEAIIARLENAFTNIPKAPKIAKPAKVVEYLLSLFPLAFLHLGLLAWGEDVWDDWDTSIAVEKYRDCMERVAQGTENATHGIVLGGGDLLHADSYKPFTPASGNILDVDSRWSKVLDTAIELMVYQIDIARQKHETVTVRILPGNHDETSAIAVSRALAAWYRNDDRVSVDKDPSLFFFHLFGKTLLGSTHGHACKLTDLPLVMANRRPQEWAAGVFRYVHGFHIHHKNQYAWEQGGCLGETHQSPAVQDAYHHGKGYISGRSMQSITYHKEYGEWARAPRVMI